MWYNIIVLVCCHNHSRSFVQPLLVCISIVFFLFFWGGGWVLNSHLLSRREVVAHRLAQENIAKKRNKQRMKARDRSADGKIGGGWGCSKDVVGRGSSPYFMIWYDKTCPDGINLQ